MSQTVESSIAGLRTMNSAQLREKYLEVFGEPSRSGNKDFLFKRIAWRMQSLSEGTLSERARQRAEELARDADLRTTFPRPPAATAGTHTLTLTVPHQIAAHDRIPIPGTLLTRKYRGKRIAVRVLERGFEYEGHVYRSLSAVAAAVTGSHWKGHAFFGLTSRKKTP